MEDSSQHPAWYAVYGEPWQHEPKLNTRSLRHAQQSTSSTVWEAAEDKVPAQLKRGTDLAERAAFAEEPLQQVAPCAVLHDDVDVLAVLEGSVVARDGRHAVDTVSPRHASKGDAGGGGGGAAAEDISRC